MVCMAKAVKHGGYPGLNKLGYKNPRIAVTFSPPIQFYAEHRTQGRKRFEKFSCALRSPEASEFRSARQCTGRIRGAAVPRLAKSYWVNAWYLRAVDGKLTAFRYARRDRWLSEPAHWRGGRGGLGRDERSALEQRVDVVRERVEHVGTESDVDGLNHSFAIKNDNGWDTDELECLAERLQGVEQPG